MGLSNDEVLRCKLEMGYNVVGVGAEAYALEGYVALFDRAIQPYLVDLGSTSSTVLAAVTTPAVATLTLASNPAVTGNNAQPVAFVQGSNIVLDVGPNVETSVIQTIAGLSITCTLSLAHGANGAYPVKLRGAEQFIRDILARIDTIMTEMSLRAPLTAGVVKVDEIQLSPGVRGRSVTRNRFDDLLLQRTRARRDLAEALGVPYLPDLKRSQGQLSTEAY